MEKKHAVIIGGSLGGLFTANLLRSIDWKVDVYERVADDLASRGAGIGTHDEMFKTLRRIGISIDETLGVKVSNRIFYDSNGKVIATAVLDRYMSSWARFYRPLKDLLPTSNYHFNKQFTHYTQSSNKITAHFNDHSAVDADLLIGADGIWSAVRNQMYPDTKPLYAGYVAWRGMVNEADIPKNLANEIFTKHTFCLPEGQYMITYPVPGANDDVRPGFRRCNFVWYHPLGLEKLSDMCTDDQGKCHGISIPHHLIRADILSEMKATARSIFAPQIADIVDLVKQPFFQSIYDCIPPTITGDKIALVGDAAFLGRPHTGMGTTKAALDAEYLIDALLTSKGNLTEALTDYNQDRSRFGMRVVERGRWLGAHLSAHLTKPKDQRSPEELEHRTPEVSMREFGAHLSDIPELSAIARKH